MPSREEIHARARHHMVQTQLRPRGIQDERVLQAFEELPREPFVPERHVGEVYEDHPVPIGFGQTISQPFIVALMVQELAPRPSDRVLEIGLGSGYQAAVLARLARHVYAVERIEELTERAMAALSAVGVNNVTAHTADGSLGWPQDAPYDRIIAAAAAPDIPQPWIDQLADGGRIVAPVGGPREQTLVVLDRHGDRIERRQAGGVRFVKLIGRRGWADQNPPPETS